MEVEIEKVASRLASLSIQLSKSRRESLIRFESSLKLELEQLGMPGAAVQVVLRWEPNPEGEVSASGKSYIVNESGLDQLEFYFSPNPGENLDHFVKLLRVGKFLESCWRFGPF
ncbi:hypothetical protein LEP1GSC170_0970 [Leptospira interrogans serovar Bataviae str. HAI135]|nr:hypothetical protein LEP1GSC170_0970 [Leptospira interrogans serovar Bataviae str. HAI135]